MKKIAKFFVGLWTWFLARTGKLPKVVKFDLKYSLEQIFNRLRAQITKINNDILALQDRIAKIKKKVSFQKGIITAAGHNITKMNERIAAENPGKSEGEIQAICLADRAVLESQAIHANANRILEIHQEALAAFETELENAQEISESAKMQAARVNAELNVLGVMKDTQDLLRLSPVSEVRRDLAVLIALQQQAEDLLNPPALPPPAGSVGR